MTNLRSGDPVERDRIPASRIRVSSRPDWSREAPTRLWDPPRQLIRCLRDYSKAKKQGGLFGLALSKIATIRHRFWSVVTGANIPLNTWNIDGGLQMPHPNGIVVHPDSKIGPNCLLFQQVTLGTGSRQGLPILGAGVQVGAGAKILGGVHIGDFAMIGANAVVVTDVPAGATAVGVPAVVKLKPSYSPDSAVLPRIGEP